MNYVIVAIVFLVAGCLIFFFRRNKRLGKNGVRLVPAVETKKAKNEPADLKEPKTDGVIDNLVAVPARIYDNMTRTVKNDMLPADDVRQIRKDYGNLGRQWYRDGDWRYAVVRLVSGRCMPIQQYMSLSLKNPPEKLHRALQQEETESWYKPRDSRSVLAKYGAYFLFAGAVIVILFLWGANMIQGKG